MPTPNCLILFTPKLGHICREHQWVLCILLDSEATGCSSQETNYFIGDAMLICTTAIHMSVDQLAADLVECSHSHTRAQAHTHTQKHTHKHTHTHTHTRARCSCQIFMVLSKTSSTILACSVCKLWADYYCVQCCRFVIGPGIKKFFRPFADAYIGMYISKVLDPCGFMFIT